MAGYAGQSTSSVFDKLQRSQQPQVEALLAWLERLPEVTRSRLINAACRCYPTLDCPRINHDSAQVSRLKMILHQASGITVVLGGNDGLRTYLVTALGHTCSMLEPERRRVCGIDVHEPDWFVPVDDVIYLRNLLDLGRLRECVERTWPIISGFKSRMTILNGIWSSVTDVDAKINQLAFRRHLLIADETGIKPEDLTCRNVVPIHILTVIEEKENRIRVIIKRI